MVEDFFEAGPPLSLGSICEGLVFGPQVKRHAESWHGMVSLVEELLAWKSVCLARPVTLRAVLSVPSQSLPDPGHVRSSLRRVPEHRG